MSDTNDHTAAKPADSSPDRSHAVVVAVCISPGGVPKHPVESATLGVEGLEGDGHAHKKHCRPERALSIQDIELLEDLKGEGYPVGPGLIGENVTVRGLHVQKLAAGDRLCFEGGAVVELTQPRRPCFVLDAVHPELQEAVRDRCGFLARVVQTGRLHTGQRITVESGSPVQ